MNHRTIPARMAIGASAIALVATACGGVATNEADTGEPHRPDASVAVAQPAGPAVPDRQFTLFDGTDVSLADFAGTPIVLNFWASWCPSCVAEMSHAFRPAQATYGARVTFVGMNIQDDRALALELLDETEVSWVNAEDPGGELYRDLGGLGMPFTVFINAAGEVVDVHNGPLTEQQLSARIAEELLE